MEEKKLDLNSIIGFVLIFGILIWIMYQNQPSEKEIAAEKAKKELVAKQEAQAKADKAKTAVAPTAVTPGDTVQLAQLQKTLGGFAYSAALPSAKEAFTTIENEKIKLKIANKGGYIVEATLKEFKKFEKNSGQLVELIKDNNAHLNIQLQTVDNRTLNTKDLFFEPTLEKIGADQVLSMRLKAGANEFLEYKYVLKPNDYLVGFDVRSQGLNKVLNSAKPLDLQWDLKTYRNEKSISYENRYAEIYYEHEDGKINYAGLGKHEEETVDKVSFIAYKQHFFTSILVTDKPFETTKLESTNLVNDEKIDTVFTKQFKANVPLAFSNGEIDYKMQWYFGPADYKVLKSYDKNFQKIIPLGWGIFGWINKLIFVPLFGFLSSTIGLSLGIAIIIFTIIIKLAMSPITYKSFLSQAKMKVLRPDIAELGEKFKKDPMKKQQETMKLYNKAGVNPMAGCIPALIQLPFMYASFQFFPAAFELRQKGFLWADDLSSFDSVVKLPFHIPLYGDHISLFPILAAIAIFFYMKMTSGDQQMAAPQQEGMPDMAKMMKIMIYVSPLMMLIFFNSYGAGLSLYNFISNLITIGIMFVIKNYIVDSDKIHAQIQENKQREPKKPSKFQQRLQEVMEQQEAAKKNQNKKK
ncbi:membrane protein insertase YidC [Flavobacterium johnsoniae]|jgi:YidC/Oxa1 family membrane protein insertase|uniref:Membrane protein insertase YidC n=1 Tax=Flavobacterium johnsoniae (strain ATCC 17061 / DSM 2064 / JCM 8514 / BCRC 14874 / CCUG 350202 / NBRC 14942 / NCIMB 11054 / UW101) TaxID=376686 RepID=A5FHA5_FLAJ1|nr:membrane protein insertase YidC [Flavobacterium johnsoniae]ABQ05411.1 protein translocase subunit yidC [Flavobacterium johnsoniae UW101]OXE96849.1 membrane protein insertase YidC [Flavobacterium johnsoniae UW101]WQG82786.1 membrane protein insertase YidC [Flavobacterium johnsoniae UW101]SHL57668.1 protein translocase subunit yidC [Flavobacterium johnsoniae]